MTTFATTARVLTSLVLGLALTTSGTALALEEGWNQEQAAKLAKDLNGKIDGLVKTAKVEDRIAGYGVKGADNYLLIQDLMQLKRFSGRLAASLENGDDREATEKVFLRIQNLVQNAALKRRSSSLLTGAQAEIDQAREVFVELAGLYGVEPDLPAPPPNVGGGK